MSGPAPADVQACFCAVLCDEWARAGVTDAVVAPGSRSTPVLAALDDEPRIRVHVVLDERCAGFVALGLGLATGRPAVVVTTSGTAAVELHPAVVEAGLSGVALIAVTTDRPPELHQVGAPQTVEQHGVFAGAERWAADPGTPDLASSGAWRSIAARSFAEALAAPGPVQLNLAMREPLVGRASNVQPPPGRPGGRPWHDAPARSAPPPPPAVVDLLGAYAGGRGIVVAGAGAGPGALRLAARLGWPLMADPRSGARVPGAHTIAATDALLRLPDVAGWMPDIVVRVGEPWASKVLGTWLAGLPAPVPQVLVDPGARWRDPDRRASHVAATTADSLCDALVEECPGGGEWLGRWRRADDLAQAAIAEILEKGGPLELSEPAVARAALAALPEGGTLLASSSMPVRDVEWYGAPRRGVTVLSNRGANGIDGVVSTGIGAALGSGRPTTVLAGDLAFLYDAGALLWAASRDVRLSVVVVDNDGGGIFSFLPQAEAFGAERFERYWGTPHGVDLAALARVYGAEAVRVTTREQLDRFLAGAGPPGCRVGVVGSERAANVAAHERIQREVAAAVAGASTGG